jgi:adenine-specific DNA-methyltransferase
MIKYLGSKRVLLPRIVELVRGFGGEVRTVLDAFSGTARVGHALKKAGYRVTANDHNAYAHCLARCYVAADAQRVRGEAERVLGELRAVPPRAGYFTETFCEKARFFRPKNGARIDAMRSRIASMSLDPDVEAVVLTSLMEAADRVDSTCGVQMAYLKKWAARADNDLELRMPDVVDGEGDALRLDAAELPEEGEWDVAYLDPPYNQHKYLNNYHVWETLVRWDAPSPYGIAMKREDCKAYQSEFNRKNHIGDALDDLVERLLARRLVVSFNDEGYLSTEEIVKILAKHGRVEAHGHDFKRYVGAQIGIYNPAGEKVGKVSHLRNQEFLFVVTRERPS